MILYLSDKAIAEEECLKPFAKEYCDNKNMILKSHNSFRFFCSEDKRSEGIRYEYLREERIDCENGDAFASGDEQ